MKVLTEKCIDFDEKDITEWIKSKFPEYGDFEIINVDGYDTGLNIIVQLKQGG